MKYDGRENKSAMKRQHKLPKLVNGKTKHVFEKKYTMYHETYSWGYHETYTWGPEHHTLFRPQVVPLILKGTMCWCTEKKN